MNHLHMGGGAAMRAATKVAVGVSRPAFRGSPLPTEQSVRNATSRQASGVGVSSQAAKSAEVTTTPETPEVTVLSQWDDWYLADDGELDVPSPPPRLVSVPTFMEAKEATEELKEAIDQLYLSQESPEVSALSPTLYEPVNRSSVIGAFSKPSVPTHAFKAFQLLSSSRDAQDVVASIVCDQNVWDAVTKNSAVTNFFQQKVADEEDVDANCAAVADEEVDKLSSCASATDEAPAETDVTSESPPGIFVDFMGLLQNAKLTVIESVSMVSSYFSKIFPIPDTPREKPSSDADGNTKASFMDNNIGMQRTFLGLAVLVIMVIMTKRF